MIPAEYIQRCAYLSNTDLELLLQKSYPEDRVLVSNFVGITNGRQFCYNIGYQDPDLNGQGLTYCKVFVWLENNTLQADY